MKLQNNISYQMADIHRLKGEALTGRLQLCILTAGAAECSLNEGSGGAGTAHDVKSLCVCYLVWVSAERMSAGTAELQDSRTIFMAKYTVVEFDQKCCDGCAGLEEVQDTSLEFCTDMITMPVVLLHSE